jgi:hypothetical protein
MYVLRDVQPGTTYALGLHQGAIAFNYMSLPSLPIRPGWRFERGPGMHKWSWAIWPSAVSRKTNPASGGGRECYAWLPLWIPAGVVLPITLLAWTSGSRRKRLLRACPSCGYDLSGLPPGSPCPECAAKAPERPHH